MIIKIKHNSPNPIYEQLIAEIEKLIISGDLKQHDSLPSIRQLATQLDVAVNTVARAYQELERRNLIVSNGRKGTFVKNKPTQETHSKDFKAIILNLLQTGMNQNEIEQAFHKTMNQIFN